jgi:hypothetical protein
MTKAFCRRSVMPPSVRKGKNYLSPLKAALLIFLHLPASNARVTCANRDSSTRRWHVRRDE